MKKFLFSYFIFCFSFFTFFASGFVDSQDGLQYLAITRRIYYDHTIEMPEANYDDRTNINFNNIKSDDGKIYAPTGIGYSLALLPAVAFEDIFNKLAGVKEIQAFPLQSDWTVLLFASMTNSFFGALYVISFYYFLRLLKVNHKQSLFLSFLLSISSNILIYSKHTFAHMMFVSLMFLSFVFFKKYSIDRKRINLLIAGLSFGIMLISYNSTYLFVLPSLGLYYLFLNLKNIKNFFSGILFHISNGFIFILGVIPFYLFNNFITSITKSSWALSQLKYTAGWLKPYIIIEGFWGILFSPGKSIFLYAPILFVLIIFWHKLEFKKYKAEVLASLVLSLTYLWFIGTLMGGPDYMLWHGESSYGNRYMLPVVSFLLVIVAIIYLKLKRREKLFIFYPILVISLFVQLVGVILPYQIRFSGLEINTKLNGRILTVYEYGNFIPRYSPIFSLSKKIVVRLKEQTKSIIESRNEIKFYDGFGYPFGAKGNYWRSIEEDAILKVPKNKLISLKVINHKIIPESSFSAILNIRNGNDKTTYSILAGREKIIKLNSNSDLLYISRKFEGITSAITPKEQVVFITQTWVNDQYQNMNTIDYPYVSPISKSLLGTNYYYWGNKQKDPWSIWHMHSGVYEKTFDFWWLRPFQYWDLPKSLFFILFITNIYFISYFGYKVLNSKF